MATSSAGRNPVELLAEEFAERLRRGETPALSEYVAKYPQYADQIRELFPALAMMEQLKPAGGDLTGPHGGPGPEEALPLECLGDYRIVREAGRGGMGVVYEAEQQALGRRVALKVLPPHALRDPDKLRRFEREARSAARLHHTNIVPVFGVGCHEGTHYYVMQFIQGLGLDEVLAELKRLRRAKGPAATDGGQARSRAGAPSAVGVAKALLTGRFSAHAAGVDASPSPAEVPAEVASPTTGPGLVGQVWSEAKPPSSVVLPGQTGQASLSESGRAYWQSVARVGIQASEALAYAHSQGILHRDVKPSNLLLDTWGTVWITDFGLAKSADSEDLTHTGDILGTMRYLAPERFQGKADARSDVYALGLTVYELLTLRPAFDETDRNKLIAQVMQAEPPRLRQLCPHLPRDLETIVLKAMDRDPSRRYQTAAELTEDLKRYVAGEPIRARRVTVWHRVILWAKRQPAQAAMLLASGVAALALVGAGVGVFYNTKLTVALEEARFHQYFHYLARANTGWLSENMAQVEKHLDACAVERRGWEWYYLKRLCHADLLTIKGHTGNATGVAFSPDGRRLASCSFDGTVKVWDAATGRPIHTLTGHTVVHSLAFSPDGTRLASAGGDRTVRVWDATTGNTIHTIPAHEDIVLSVAFSPDGTRIASTSKDGTVKFWDAATGRAIATLPREHTGVVSGIAFSPDGMRLASSSYLGGLIVWDATTHKVLHKIPSHAGGFLGVAFSPDGTRIVPASSDGTVRVWDATTGREVLTFKDRHSSGVWSVAFSPDGTQLASAGMDGAVKVWDVTTGQLTFTYLGHTSEVRSVAFSPDGTRLASVSSDQTVKVWDATDGSGPRTFPGHEQYLLKLAFSPDGTRIASGGMSGMVEVCDVTTGQELLTLKSSPSVWVWGVAFSPDGARLASSGPGGTVIIWDARTGDELFRLKGHNKDVTGVAFGPDGIRIASGAGDGTVKVWAARTGELLHNLEGHTDSVRSVAFSPDGTRLASASNDHSVRVWDAETGRPIHILTGHTHFVHGVAFSPDGTRLASAGHDTTVRVWDTITGKKAPQLLGGHTSAVFSVAFSPDGTRIASGAWDGTVKVWDAATGEEALTLKGHRDEVRSVAFSPDGALLASAGRDRTVKIWDARPWTPAAAIEREALGLLACLFAKPLCRSDVIDNLRLPLVTPPAREMALGLIERYKEETNPERYHQASWAILRQPYLNAFQYGFALRQAKTACRLAPENGECRISLGVAQYRAGQLQDALDTLKQVDQRDSDSPAFLAFQAMAQHRLGLNDQARATLEHLWQTMQKAEWLMNAEACAFVREAEAVLKAATPTRNEGI